MKLRETHQFREGGKLSLAVMLAALTATLVAIGGEVIYQNDFTTRTSAGPIPSGKWRQQSYFAGLMANTDYEKPFGDITSAPPQNMQDGWIKNKSTGTKSGANAYIYKDAGNNSMAVLGHTNAATISSSPILGRVILKQRIGNTFTRGIVTMRLDMRPPAVWQSFSDGLRRAIVCVGDEDYFSPDVEKPSIFSRTAATAGIYIEDLRKVYYRSNSGEVRENAEIAQGHWLRLVLTLDLDNRTWGFSIYDMGTDHPGQNATLPATPVYTRSAIPFCDSSVTSISAIALCGFGVCWNADGDQSAAPAGAVCFDNIFIFHNDEECYRNNFGTREWRDLAAGTAVATYVADCTVTNTVGTEMYTWPSPIGANGVTIVPSKKDGGVSEPIGLDGWRRLYTASDLGANDVNLRNDNDNCCVRFADNKSSSGVAHPIGTCVSNGTLRMKIDMRVPSAWNGDRGRLYVSLGNDTLYNGYQNACQNGRYLHVGISSKGSTTNAAPRTAAKIYDTYALKMATWYRAEITAYLDSGTYDYTLYEQGSTIPSINAANGEEVFSLSGAQRMNNVDKITTLALWGMYGVAYYDNIQIWHTPAGGTEETLLYRNTFSSRTIYSQDRREGLLTGTLMKDPEGQDRWRAVHVGTMSAAVTDEANPSATFKNSGGSYGYAIHDLGQTIDSGVVLAQADIRPPRGWAGGEGSFYLRMGSDYHFTGSINNQSADSVKFLLSVAMGFGFKRMSGSRVNGLYTNVVLVAWQGNLSTGGSFVQADPDVQVDPAHWYRFVAKSRVVSNHYNLFVYDMGSSHPEMDTPLPAAPVATFAALPYRRRIENMGGLSCFSLNANYTASSPVDDTQQPYIDNIRILRLSGLSLSFR